MVGLLEGSDIILQNAINGSIQNVVMNIINMLPNLIVAIIFVAIGWFVAWVLSVVFEKLLASIGLEVLLKRYNLADALGGIVISTVLVRLLKYYVFLLFVQQAVDLVDLGAISRFISIMLLYAPAVIGAILLVVVAALFGELVKDRIMDVHMKSHFLKSLGAVAKALIVFIGLVMALGTVGFNISILEGAFIVIMQGAVYGVALAVGLAFGLGGQDEARSLLKDWKGKIKNL